MPQVQKANPCLKKLFYVLNSLLLIAGCLLFILALWGNNNQSGGIQWIYVTAVGLIIVPILGIFGARRENAVALVIFTVMMMVGAIFLFIKGIQVSFVYLLFVSQARQEIESQYQDHPDIDLLMKGVDHALRSVLGISFGFSAAAILGVILSMCLLRQIGPCTGNLQPSLSDNAVPTTHDPMINAVPMPCYPSLA